ncbi:hypothetical protein ACA910_005784 [Epithemia clementina (nom. ined.)]
MQHTLAWLQQEFGQDFDTQNAPLQTHAIPVEEAEEEKENEEEEKYKENEEDEEDKEEREEDSERVGRANQIHQIQDSDDNEGGPPTVTVKLRQQSPLMNAQTRVKKMSHDPTRVTRQIVIPIQNTGIPRTDVC